MPFLYREIRFCECGRPAPAEGGECRTCREDALRRKWRDEYRLEASMGTPEPVGMIQPRFRSLFAPEVMTKDEADLFNAAVAAGAV